MEGPQKARLVVCFPCPIYCFWALGCKICALCDLVAIWLRFDCDLKEPTVSELMPHGISMLAGATGVTTGPGLRLITRMLANKSNEASLPSTYSFSCATLNCYCCTRCGVNQCIDVVHGRDRPHVFYPVCVCARVCRQSGRYESSHEITTP